MAIFLALPFLADRSLATIVFLAAAIGLSIAIASRADRLLEEHDSGCIVVDEVAGMLVALAGHGRDPWSVVLAFLFFRLFDVLKIWPAGAIDRRMAGGPGVVLDDVVSGFYAHLVTGFMLS